MGIINLITIRSRSPANSAGWDLRFATAPYRKRYVNAGNIDGKYN